MKKITTALLLLQSLISFSQIVDIPDPNFKNALLNYSPVIDTNGDGEIQVSEAVVVEEIDVSSMGVSDLTGIEAFVNLEDLRARFNTITEIDVSDFGALRTLWLSGNQLTEIDITSNTQISSLLLDNNVLEEIDVSNNTSLVFFWISRNNITTIDITNNLSLETFQARDLLISEIDVSNNLALEKLFVGSDNLTELEISNLTMLEWISFEGEISQIDLSNNLELKVLETLGSPISHLDLSGNDLLTNLFIRNTEVTNLDLSNNLALEYLTISETPLDAINILENESLININIINTTLTEIDISNNINLNFLGLNVNELTSIDVSNNFLLEQLVVSNNQISSIDVSNNINLRDLAISNNALNNVDLSQNLLLETLSFNRSSVSNLDLSNNTQIEFLSIYETQIEEIDLSNLPLLEKLFIDNSAIRILDLSNNPICTLRANDNFLLESINLNNNLNTLFDPSVGCLNTFGQPTFTLENCPNLEFVCVDDVAFAQEFMQPKSPQTAYVEDCSLVESNLNRINGTVTYDENENGCDAGDPTPNGLLINTTNETDNFANTSNGEGFYTIPVGEGTFTTSILGLPDYFAINPTEELDTFSGFDQTEIADFCLQPLGENQDLSIAIAPTNQARPGFNASYAISYENMGTAVVSGTSITLTFNDDRAAFDTATPAPIAQTDNTLTWEVGDFNVFQIAAIEVRFDVFAPPINDSGDILEFEATISPSASDATPEDNSFVLEQEIVNSFDPNDITILEGPEITIENVDQYVHYLVRFQNTGTASAITVRVQNELEEKLDWTTFRLLDSSHDVEVQLVNQQIDFVFDDINLPNETSDPEGSQGYILYEIKPVDEIVLGDTIDNTAAIYFDFNAPIITNTTSTTFVTDPLALSDINNRLVIQVFPNPSSDVLQIKGGQHINVIEIFDLQGKKVSSNTVFGTEKVLNISSIPSGLYFIKMYTDNGNEVRKFLKK